MNTPSRCHVSPRCGHRRRRLPAKSAPNFRRQCRMLSWVTTMPRSARIRLDIAQAETEDMIQPDRLADDLGRKPVPRIREGLDRHAVSVAHLLLTRQRRLTWQCRHPVSLLRDTKAAILIGFERHGGLPGVERAVHLPTRMFATSPGHPCTKLGWKRIPARCLTR